MTVLGRGLVFQPVLVTQTCTYSRKNITLTLQIFHQKKIFFKKNITTPLLPERERERERERREERERERERERGGGGGWVDQAKENAIRLMWP